MRIYPAFITLGLPLFLSHSAVAAPCPEMQAWDASMAMCMPLPMENMRMSMLMLQGNLFGVFKSETGPRARDAAYSPNMVMADLGTSIGAHHYLNLDFMGTAEKWTVPANGYPILLQIGENQANGQPFLDAQHPHSSPIMGLTLSDTLALGASGSQDYVKAFFAPRGESTDGPIAFMHRDTGMVNPEAPLGHHVGQDVGHISSTVIGAALKLGGFRAEVSTYHGAEPQPTAVDLPIAAPDSVSFRVMEEWSPGQLVMASVAYVHQPEPDQPDIGQEMRYSMSFYNELALSPGWTFHNSLIYGAITKYDHADLLNSFTEEFWFHGGAPNIWGRIEVLQRTPGELEIFSPAPNSGKWVAALTLGYTEELLRVDEATLSAGAAGTKTLLPSDLIGAYGGDPWSGQVFLEIRGLKMWDL